MKILFVNSNYNPIANGGAELVCRKTAEAFVNRGYSVDVLTIDNHYHTESHQGVKVIYLDTIIGKGRSKQNKLIRIFLNFLRVFSITDLGKLKRLLITEKYDIINTHAIEDISPVIWYAAKMCRIPIVHTMHDRYLLCPWLFLIKRNGSACEKRKLICKLRTRFFLKFASYVSAFISPSQSLAKTMPVESVVINNGMKMMSENIKREYPDNRPFRFVFVGTLAKHKGLGSLLNAFDRYSANAELHIAGDGEMRESVISATKKDNRIHYHGWIDNSKMADFLNNFDCLIMPSICLESYGMVILESYNVIMPVIGSNLGGISELVTDNETGYLFSPCDEEDIRSKMQMIMEKKNWERMTANIPRIKHKYSIENQVDKYEALFGSIVHK